MRSAAHRNKNDYLLVLFGSWHAAAFQRSKKMPRLDAVLKSLGEKSSGKKKQTVEQMMTTVEFINAMHGGSDRRNKK